MKRYLVDVMESHIVTYSVLADSPEEAVKMVGKGEGSYVDTELEERHPYTATVVSDDLPVDYDVLVYTIADRRGVEMLDAGEFIHQAYADGLEPEAAVSDWVKAGEEEEEDDEDIP